MSHTHNRVGENDFIGSAVISAERMRTILVAREGKQTLGYIYIHFDIFIQIHTYVHFYNHIHIHIHFHFHIYFHL